MGASIFDYKGHYQERQVGLLTDLQGKYLSGTKPATLQIATAGTINSSQEGFLASILAGTLDVTEIRQRILADRRKDGNGALLVPPELGDAEISIAGVPNVSGSAAALAASVMRALAAVGIAGALWNFSSEETATSEEKSEVVQRTVASVSSSVLLPLGVIAFIVFNLRKI